MRVRSRRFCDGRAAARQEGPFGAGRLHAKRRRARRPEGRGAVEKEGSRAWCALSALYSGRSRPPVVVRACARACACWRVCVCVGVCCAHDLVLLHHRPRLALQCACSGRDWSDHDGRGGLLATTPARLRRLASTVEHALPAAPPASPPLIAHTTPLHIPAWPRSACRACSKGNGPGNPFAGNGPGNPLLTMGLVIHWRVASRVVCCVGWLRVFA
jgi:hypothetical protein